MNNITSDFKDKKILEKYSSAYTLSDMEIFIFPELFYPLVLANIMSPIIWKWRDDPWFKDIHKKTFTYKINRVKQYIMEHYVFNLDLETWGLTNKEKELDRFRDFFDIEILKQSNALFGYEGDKYYFDIDIRKHFGFDKYSTDTIPYWKTETIEAMTAFKYKEGYINGAGECVSLSALYAAALFVVGRIPLEKIFLIATPLHSQNFINVDEGVITNNRRIVTKKMWFNGSLMSARARRALENEKVTIVAHITGYIHTAYPLATIHPTAYKVFITSLRNYLKTNLTPEIFINYLRYDMTFKQCFQYKHIFNGRDHYIELEKIFAYEHLSNTNFSESNRKALLDDIDMEEYSLAPIEGRICLGVIEAFLTENSNLDFAEIKKHFIKHAKETKCDNLDNIRKIFEGLESFINLHPRLPLPEKEFETEQVPEINIHQSREEIRNQILNYAEKSSMAKLAVYTFRLMDKIDWTPFVKAALERNPVSLEALKGKSVKEVVQIINGFANESIYDEKRLAQPDEVWNFKKGDGIEKAILLASFIINTSKTNGLKLSINGKQVVLKQNETQFVFTSTKEFDKREINLP